MEKPNEFPESFSLTAGERIVDSNDVATRDQAPPFYEGGQRRYVIDQAIHHLHFDTAAVLILGEEGSGKTALLDQLLNDLQESMDGCLLDVEAIGPAGLLPELAAGLDLHDVVDFTCESVARAAAQRSTSIGLPLLVTLDNAEVMSAEQIDALFEVARLSHGSVRLLLCGDVSLQVMADRAAQGEALFALQLPPLSRAEVGEYLQFLARRRGQLARLSLSAEVLEAIYSSSHGNIALINVQSLELFTSGSGMRAFKWRDVTRMPLLHLGLVIALVVFILILRMSGTGSSVTPEPIVASTPSSQPIAMPAPTAPDSTIPAESGQAMVSKELKLPDAVSVQPTQAQPAAQPEQPTALPPSQMASDASNQLTFPSAAQSTSPVAPEDAAKVVDKPVVQKEAPEKPAAKPSTPTAKTARTAGNGKNLLAMPSSAFVLQVFASHDKPKVAKFVKNWQSKVKISSFETRHNGKPWYVAVVAGPYKSSDKARAAVAKLPAGLRAQKPWPRQLATIQQDIRQLN